MKKLFVSSIFVGVLTLLVACGKQVMEPQQSLRLGEGRLVFENQEAYNNTIAEYQNKGNIATLKNRFENFQSMKNAFDAITVQYQEKIGTTLDLTGYEGFLVLTKESSGELSADIPVEDPILNQVLNKDGLVQIGEKLVKYTATQKLEVENPSPAQEMILAKYADGKTLPDFTKTTKIKETVTNTRCGNTQGEANYTHGGKTKRIVGQTIINTTAGGGYINATTKHQVKNVGIGWADAAEQLKISSTGTICFISGTCTNQFLPVGAPATTNPTSTIYNDNNFTWTINSVQPIAPSSQFHIYTSHQVKCDDGVFRTAYSDK